MQEFLKKHHYRVEYQTEPAGERQCFHAASFEQALEHARGMCNVVVIDNVTGAVLWPPVITGALMQSMVATQ